jgi:hypothetical protein
VKLRCVPATFTPYPTWYGLEPPVVSPGADPSLMVREIAVEKSILLAL